MNERDDKNYIICASVSEGGEIFDRRIEGSVIRNCAECDRSVWVAPSGQKMIEEQDLTICCPICLLQHETDVLPQPLTQEQIDELSLADKRDRL